VHELLTELELAESRAIAAESAVRAGYGRDLVPLRPATSALVVWRPRDNR
jgi:MerR family transcriptional regulator/heat shock protein HspR